MIITLPDWVVDIAIPSTTATVEERMQYVLTLARENVARGGGPFAAAVFDDASGRCLGQGVNLVQQLHCSMLHAEVVAIMMAEERIGSYSLADVGATTLYTSAEPCAMCLGSIPWSGVRNLVCAARDEDVRSIGFDEGTKPQPWSEALTSRGVIVTTDVLRSASLDILRSYAAAGGTMYNGH